MASLLGGRAAAEPAPLDLHAQAPRQRARANRVIFMHMAGGPSQFELFDEKPELTKRDGEPCPDAFIDGQRFAFIKGRPKLLAPRVIFSRHGDCGACFSNLLPNLASCADELTIVRSLTTDQFNHAPAQLLMQTGSQLLGSASLGAWAAYGLGSVNRDLPAFIVLLSGGRAPDAGKSIWGSGFLPGVFQGTQCRSEGVPILFVDDPPGMDRSVRRRSLDALGDLNRMHAAAWGSP